MTIYPIRTWVKSLTLIGRIDPTTGRRIGLAEALFIADLILDEGPSPSDLTRADDEPNGVFPADYWDGDAIPF